MDVLEEMSLLVVMMFRSVRISAELVVEAAAERAPKQAVASCY